jgi:HD-GYP domain-containing protein (c-di-GMP phosphodiesterase class II)
MVHIVSGYPEALRTLVAAVEAKDAYTHGHSVRTARLAVQLGMRLGLDEDQLRAVARGGYLHDVGKIAIPDAVLNKPGRLSPEERVVIETHPRIGYELVSPSVTLAEAVPAVLHHHERWDGSGYPDGLRGSAIPLVARVVAVADVWDALTSDRAYRAGLAPEVALGHLLAGRGSHFQPELVDAFVGLAADWGYTATAGGDADAGWEAVQTCHEVAASRV